MDQEPPIKRNVFLIAIVIFFNLIWLTLLFMSCQADEKSQPEITPIARIDSCQYSRGILVLNPPTSIEYDQRGVSGSARILADLVLRTKISPFTNHNVPEYKPPST